MSLDRTKKRATNPLAGEKTQKRHGHRSPKNPRSVRPNLELLEDRTVLSPVTVSIWRLVELDHPDFDDGVDGFCLGDYYARVTFNGFPVESSEVTHDPGGSTGCIISGPEIYDGLDTLNRWTFSREFPPGSGEVTVKIEIFDGDGISDDHMDIHPNPIERDILLLVDPQSGQWHSNIQGNISVAEGDGDKDGRVRVFFDVSTLSASGDEDGDGLLDGWEQKGIFIDPARTDGRPDLDLPALGANPGHKDLFVEVDAMTGRGPSALPPIDFAALVPGQPYLFRSPKHGLTSGTRILVTGVNGVPGANGVFAVIRIDSDWFQLENTLTNPTDVYLGGGVWHLADVGPQVATNTSLDLVIDAFARRGINLHTELDETGLSLPSEPWTDGWGHFDILKSTHFGSPSQRAAPDSPTTLEAKGLVYRYAVFADRYYNKSENEFEIGGAESPGNDFFVTLGEFERIGVGVDQQAGTFMHELGHTLGLQHGGSEKLNYKPNYHSVMNDNWVLPNAQYDNVAASWRLDYSRGAFPSLDELKLNEYVGLGGPDDHIGHMVYVPGLVGRPVNKPGEVDRVVPEVGRIDWNGRNGIERAVRVDLNGDGAGLLQKWWHSFTSKHAC